LLVFEYTKNLLVLKYIPLVLPYSILITVILVTLTNSIWGAGDGMVRGLELQNYWKIQVFTLFYVIMWGFAFFLAIIPSLITTGLIIRKKSKEVKLLK